MQAPLLVQQDPSISRRYKLAQSLLDNSTQYEPTTPIGVAGKLAQALAGVYLQNKTDKDVKERQDAVGNTLEQAMRAGSGFRDPDNPEKMLVPGSREQLAAVLSGNPDTAPLGLQTRLADMDYQRQREDKLSDTKSSQDFTLKRDSFQNEFTAAQGELNRAHAEAMQNNTFENQAKLQLAQQRFAAAENALNRTQALNIAQMNRVPAGYELDPARPGGQRPIAGGPADPQQAGALAKAKRQAVQLPASALKMATDEMDAIGAASSIQSDIGALKKQIDDGKLSLGPVSNAANAGRNWLGISNQESRDYQSFKATLEKMRNDSLRLNKGVQTEGDAVRAWNELVSNINDPKVVSQRLGEIEKINQRAADLRKVNVETIYRNFGGEPPDLSRIQNVAPAVGNGGGGVKFLGFE